MIDGYYRVVGVMSGSSLDGLDLAYCEFRLENSQWHYHLEVAETIEYPEILKRRLRNAKTFTGLRLALLNTDYGHFLGQEIQRFIEKNALTVDLVSVHGHTVFHQPERRLTLQIGDGAAIARYMKCPVVTEFRNIDVALGGQGAPLVPIGDKLLFGDNDFHLNLGGIANISLTQDNKITAFDVCVCNMALNYLMPPFDKDGFFASSGKLNTKLLERLNALDFFAKQPPKSLGAEWFETNLLPILEHFDCSVEDKLHTVCEHIALQISNVINVKTGHAPSLQEKTIMVTGGGAKNIFLMSRIKHHCACKFSEVDPRLIDFKEALIFAFLGVLRLRGHANCLSDVTGARHDNIGGCVYSGNWEL